MEQDDYPEGYEEESIRLITTRERLAAAKEKLLNDIVTIGFISLAMPVIIGLTVYEWVRPGPDKDKPSGWRSRDVG